jgi:aryl-alcohol dehydrogenase-like predicted oxidoreductase
MSFFVREGKVKYLGISECTPQDLRRAHAVHPIAAYQMEVSPFSRHVLDPKLEFLKTARELGATMVVYSPLGRGMLTGQVVGLFSNPSIIKLLVTRAIEVL